MQYIFIGMHPQETVREGKIDSLNLERLRKRPIYRERLNNSERK